MPPSLWSNNKENILSLDCKSQNAESFDVNVAYSILLARFKTVGNPEIPLAYPRFGCLPKFCNPPLSERNTRCDDVKSGNLKLIELSERQFRHLITEFE